MANIPEKRNTDLEIQTSLEADGTERGSSVLNTTEMRPIRFESSNQTILPPAAVAPVDFEKPAIENASQGSVNPKSIAEELSERLAAKVTRATIKPNAEDQSGRVIKLPNPPSRSAISFFEAVKAAGDNCVIEHPSAQRQLNEDEILNIKLKSRREFFEYFINILKKLKTLLVNPADMSAIDRHVLEITTATNHIIDFVLPDICSDLLTEGIITMSDNDGWLMWNDPIKASLNGKPVRISSKHKDTDGNADDIFAIELADKGDKFKEGGNRMFIRTSTVEDGIKKEGYYFSITDTSTNTTSTLVSLSRADTFDASKAGPNGIGAIGLKFYHLAVALNKALAVAIENIEEQNAQTSA